MAMRCSTDLAVWHGLAKTSNDRLHASLI